MDLSEPGYGVSVLNDSRYGCDVHGSVMRLTLLRGAEWPDPDADRGAHELIYSLYPHAGDWTSADTARKAWELNVPVTAAPTVAGQGAVGRGAAGRAAGADARAAAVPPARRFFSVEGPGILQALKAAEDGNGWILRFYEPHGARGTVHVAGPRSLAAVEECNHVEEGGSPHAHEGASFSFTLLPFQVRTFRVRF
jgi:alpha-mannosidase